MSFNLIDKHFFLGCNSQTSKVSFLSKTIIFLLSKVSQHSLQLYKYWPTTEKGTIFLLFESHLVIFPVLSKQNKFAKSEVTANLLIYLSFNKTVVKSLFLQLFFFVFLNRFSKFSQFWLKTVVFVFVYVFFNVDFC